MTRFLERASKQSSPTTPTPAETRLQEFANAVAAFRKATGKPETRAVPCRCAVTGLRFVIVFERLSLSDRFQIARIEHDDAASHRTDHGSRLSSSQSLQKTYDAAEFEWAGCACPHCGDGFGMIYCGACRETVCAGRVRPQPDGSTSFTCHDACGATGTIEPYTLVHGSGAGREGPAQASRLPGSATAGHRLPDSAMPRLPGRQPK